MSTQCETDSQFACGQVACVDNNFTEEAIRFWDVMNNDVVFREMFVGLLLPYFTIDFKEFWHHRDTLEVIHLSMTCRCFRISEHLMRRVRMYRRWNFGGTV